MSYLTVDEILAADDLPAVDVDVPEWGGKVRVQGLSKAAQHHIQNQCMRPDGELDQQRLEVAMFVACCVEPKFGDEHVDALRRKSAKAFDRVVQAAIELTGGGDSDAAGFLPGDEAAGAGDVPGPA